MNFTKMQGAGNDFIIIDNREGAYDDRALQKMAQRLCSRRVSIGADGLMAIQAPKAGGDIYMNFFNSDGSIGEMCGNAARCISRYCRDNGISGDEPVIETLSGTVYGKRISERVYEVKLNDPSVIDLHRTAFVGTEPYDCAYVELGVPGLPHAVVHMPGLADMSDDYLRPIGRQLRSDPAFPKGANVNFWDKIGYNHLILKTFERGVEDFTLACGTGTGSAAAVLALTGVVNPDNIVMDEPGGTLSVTLTLDNGTVRDICLMGPTNIVCSGKVLDEELNV